MEINHKERSVKEDQETMKPKKLTLLRREVLDNYLRDVYANPHKYGKFAGEMWINELIHRLRKRNGSTGNVSSHDVNYWLSLSIYAEVVGRIRYLESVTVSPKRENAPSSSGNNGNGTLNKLLNNSRNSRDTTKVQIPTASTVDRVTNILRRGTTEHDVNTTSVKSELGTTPSPQTSTTLFSPLAATDSQAYASQAQVEKKEAKGLNDSEIEIHFQPSVTVIHIPPSIVPTTLILKTASWEVFTCHPDSQTEAFTPASSDAMDMDEANNPEQTAAESKNMTATEEEVCQMQT